MTAFQATPGTGGAVPPLTAVSSTPGAGALTITCTQPVIPAGWTQTSVVGLAFINSDPAPAVQLLPVEAEDAATPFTVILFTGLPAATYYWAAWNRITAPDQTVRYSPHLDGTQVVA